MTNVERKIELLIENALLELEEALVSKGYVGKEGTAQIKKGMSLDNNPKRKAAYQNKVNEYEGPRKEKLDSLKGWRQERDRSRQQAKDNPKHAAHFNASGNYHDNKARISLNPSSKNFKNTANRENLYKKNTTSLLKD